MACIFGRGSVMEAVVELLGDGPWRLLEDGVTTEGAVAWGGGDVGEGLVEQPIASSMALERSA